MTEQLSTIARTFPVDHRWDRSRDVGARSRTPAPGPESELIEEFLQSMEIRLAPGTAVTVYRETALECGFPDVVLVQWRWRQTRRWPQARASLLVSDYKVLQFLQHFDCVTKSDLATRFGRSIMAAVERLVDADVVTTTTNLVRARPLRHTYAVQRIIAIEAKLRDGAGALKQAQRNFWFATDSWILWHDDFYSPSVEQRAAAQSIVTVHPNEHLIELTDLCTPRFPRSYAAWLFNDWSWRRYNL